MIDHELDATIRFAPPVVPGLCCAQCLHELRGHCYATIVPKGTDGSVLDEQGRPEVWHCVPCWDRGA